MMRTTIIRVPKLPVVLELNRILIHSLTIHQKPQRKPRSELQISALLPIRIADFILIRIENLGRKAILVLRRIRLLILRNVDAAPAWCESAGIDWLIGIKAGEVHAALGNAAFPFARAAFGLVVVEPGADVRAVVAGDAVVGGAITVLPFFGGEVRDGDFFPVADVFELKDRGGQAFAVDAVDVGECYAEVADARVGEVE